MVNVIRNDGAATLQTGTNLTPGCQSVDAYGRAYVAATVNPSATDTAAAQFVANSAAFGAVTTSYTTLLTNTNRAKILRVTNKLDQDVWISADGVANHILVAQSEAMTIDLIQSGIDIRSNVSVKALATPTSGNIYGTIIY